MRYSPTLYATALYRVIESGESGDYKTIFKNLWNTVKKNGDQSKVDSIINAFENLVVKSNGGRMVQVETARDINFNLSKEVGSLFVKEDVVIRSINSKIVAGIRIVVDGEQELDFSLATKLRKMFGEQRK